MEQYDAAVIGSGVIGNAVARELSRTKLSCVVLEKEADTAFGISSRNSGVVHSGIHYTPGSNRARFCVEGNAAVHSLCSDLSVAFQLTGKLTAAFTKEQHWELEALKAQGEANGVPGLEILTASQMESFQPGISGRAALYSPTTGIVNPISLTIALAEHAHANGAVYKFLHEVTGISQTHQGRYRISFRNQPSVEARMVINCAGLHADTLAAMTGYAEHRIYPCRGEYYVLDKRLAGQLNLLIYPVPGEHSTGLGIHLTNTTEGNILIGPSNEYVDSREDYASTRQIMKTLRDEAKTLLPALETGDFIRSFSGNRPKLTPPEIGGFGDFVIHQEGGVINVVGIESPGLTSAPAIAGHIFSLVQKYFQPEYKTSWSPGFREERGIYRRAYPASFYSADERRDLISQDPDYGFIICRCEEISKAELRSAVKRMFGPITLAGIKQRCRTMTGRCQGGFCLPRIAEFLQDEYALAPEEIFYKGPSSPVFTGHLRKPGGSSNAV